MPPTANSSPLLGEGNTWTITKKINKAWHKKSTCSNTRDLVFNLLPTQPPQPLPPQKHALQLEQLTTPTINTLAINFTILKLSLVRIPRVIDHFALAVALPCHEVPCVGSRVAKVGEASHGIYLCAIGTELDATTACSSAVELESCVPLLVNGEGRGRLLIIVRTANDGVEEKREKKI